MASLNPADPAASGSRTNVNLGTLIMSNVTLKQCVLMAYRIQGYQLSGGPPWFDAARYDISAKMDVSAEQLVGPAARARMEIMLQNLLADRFKLVVHREFRQVPAYLLMLAKNGPKLKLVPDDDRTSTSAGNGRITARKISMPEFAARLSTLLDRPVSDRTGLSGVFELTLEWTPDDKAENRGPTIFTALQEQLGLKLESQREPVEFVIVDRAAMPSSN